MNLTNKVVGPKLREGFIGLYHFTGLYITVVLFYYQYFWVQNLSIYLYRKGLKARYLTASLALRWTLTHDIPSVFHADQHGMRPFLNFGL